LCRTPTLEYGLLLHLAKPLSPTVALYPADFTLTLLPPPYEDRLLLAPEPFDKLLVLRLTTPAAVYCKATVFKA